jgi:hypothetical protein
MKKPSRASLTAKAKEGLKIIAKDGQTTKSTSAS